MAGPLKRTTGLTGMAVAQFPHKALRVAYERTLHHIEKMPETARYRMSTHAMISDKLSKVNSIKEVAALEKALDSGFIEEAILMAQREEKLAEQLLFYKPWEPLCEEAPPDQWKWPPT